MAGAVRQHHLADAEKQLCQRATGICTVGDYFRSSRVESDDYLYTELFRYCAVGCAAKFRNGGTECKTGGNSRWLAERDLWKCGGADCEWCNREGLGNDGTDATSCRSALSLCKKARSASCNLACSAVSSRISSSCSGAASFPEAFLEISAAKSAISIPP